MSETAKTADVCPRCGGEEVIWGGCFQDGTSNCYDPCPDCMGFDDDEGAGND